MADIVQGDRLTAASTECGDRVHQSVEPLSPLGILKIDTDPQRVFGVVNFGQKFLGDKDPAVFLRATACNSDRLSSNRSSTIETAMA